MRGKKQIFERVGLSLLGLALIGVPVGTQAQSGIESVATPTPTHDSHPDEDDPFGGRKTLELISPEDLTVPPYIMATSEVGLHWGKMFNLLAIAEFMKGTFGCQVGPDLVIFTNFSESFGKNWGAYNGHFWYVRESKTLLLDSYSPPPPQAVLVVASIIDTQYAELVRRAEIMFSNILHEYLHACLLRGEDGVEDQIQTERTTTGLSLASSYLEDAPYDTTYEEYLIYISSRPLDSSYRKYYGISEADAYAIPLTEAQFLALKEFIVNSSWLNEGTDITPLN